MNSNSENPKVGANFQNCVAEWFRDTYKKEFVVEKKIPIGDPAKNHTSQRQVRRKEGKRGRNCSRSLIILNRDGDIRLVA